MYAYQRVFYNVIFLLVQAEPHSSIPITSDQYRYAKAFMAAIKSEPVAVQSQCLHDLLVSLLKARYNGTGVVNSALELYLVTCALGKNGLGVKADFIRKCYALRWCMVFVAALEASSAENSIQCVQ
jgi:hypothetical protein